MNGENSFQTAPRFVLNNAFGGFFCTVVISLSGICASADGTDDRDTPPGDLEIKRDTVGWWHETPEIAKQTFTNKRNLALLGVAGLGSAALMLTSGDEDIRDWVDDRGIPDGVGTAGNVLGLAGPVLLDLGLYTHGRLSGNERSVEVSKVLATALAIDGVSTTAMKVTIGRHRPSDGASGKFDPFSVTHRAFPSGHTSFSFTTAAVMSEMYEERRWVKITAYTAATFVGVARISDDSHWTSDVLFGAVKGYVIGKTVSRLHKKRKLEDVRIIADIGRDRSYIGLGFDF